MNKRNEGEERILWLELEKVHDNTLFTQLEHLLLPKKLADVNDQMNFFYTIDYCRYGIIRS